jgi:TolB protein
MRIPATVLLALAATAALCRAAEGDVPGLPAETQAAADQADETPAAEAAATETPDAEVPAFDDRFPMWSPDGARIAFVSDRDEPGIFQLYVANADGSGLNALTSGVAGADWPVWTPDGEWIYYDSRKGERIEIFRVHSSGGEPVQVTESEEGSDSHVSLSVKGGVAFDSNREADGLRKIYTMAPDGTKLRLITVNPHSNSFPAWSPDGEWIAFRIRNSTFSPVSEIHVIKPDGSGLRAVTKLGAAATHPAWSPDGTRIVFVAVIDGNHEICVTSADGVTVERLTETERNELRPTFSHDGTEILFCANESGRFGIYKMKADGSEPQLVGFVTENRAAEEPLSP